MSLRRQKRAREAATYVATVAALSTRAQSLLDDMLAALVAESNVITNDVGVSASCALWAKCGDGL
jgi:hypothetical protein